MDHRCIGLALGLFCLSASAAWAEERPRPNVIEDKKYETYEDLFGYPPEKVKEGLPLLADPAIGFNYKDLSANGVEALDQQAQFHSIYFENQLSNEIWDALLAKEPHNSTAIWRRAMNLYDIGEELPEEAIEEKMKLYEEVIVETKACLERDPKASGCHFFYGVGLGRKATTEGILNSLFTVEDVEGSFLKALEMPDSPQTRRGDSIHSWANYALGQLYRILPDWWIIELIAGARGDKEKSVEYMRKAVKGIPNQMGYRKELGVSLVCYGGDEDDEKAIAEGREILRKVAAGEWRDWRNTDEIDMKHAAILAEQEPDVVCSYSRDGYENLDQDQIKKD